MQQNNCISMWDSLCLGFMVKTKCYDFHNIRQCIAIIDIALVLCLSTICLKIDVHALCHKSQFYWIRCYPQFSGMLYQWDIWLSWVSHSPEQGWVPGWIPVFQCQAATVWAAGIQQKGAVSRLQDSTTALCSCSWHGGNGWETCWYGSRWVYLL